MSKWYYSKDGQAVGPVDENFIKDEIRAGRLTLIDLVFLKGDNKWKPISEFSELAELTKTSITLKNEDDEKEREWVVLKKQLGAGQNQYDQIGPFTMAEVIEKLNAGEIKYADHIWRTGFKKWVRIGHLPEFDRRESGRESNLLEVPVPEDVHSLGDVAVDEVDFSENILKVEKEDPFAEEEAPPEARGEDLAKPSLADIPGFDEIDEFEMDLDDSVEEDSESEMDLSAVRSDDSIAVDDFAVQEEVKLSDLGSTDELEPLSMTGSEPASELEIPLDEGGKTASVLSEDHLVGGPSLNDVEEEVSGLAEETVNMSPSELMGDDFTGSVHVDDHVQDPLQAGPQVPEPVDPVEPEEPEEVSPEREERAEAATEVVQAPQDQRVDEVNVDRKKQLSDSFVDIPNETGTGSVTSDFKKPLEKSYTAIEEEIDALNSENSAEGAGEGGLGTVEPSQFDISLSDIEEELEKSSPKKVSLDDDDDTVQLQDPQPDNLVPKQSKRAQNLSDEFNRPDPENLASNLDEKSEEDSEDQGFFDDQEESVGVFGVDAESEGEESEFNSFDEKTFSSSEPIQDQDVSKVITIEEVKEKKPEETETYKKKKPFDINKFFVPLALLAIVGLVGFGLFISYPKWKTYVENFDPFGKIGDIPNIEIDNSDDPEFTENQIPDPPDTFEQDPENYPEEVTENQNGEPLDPREDPVEPRNVDPQPKNTPAVVAQETPKPRPTAKPRPARKASRLSLAGQSLSSSNARLKVTSNASPGASITILAKGQSGRILDRISYYRKLTRKADKSGNLSLSLKEIGAPIGSLVFEVSVDSLDRRIEIFHGRKNNDFNKKLRAHLKEISLTQQSQKKALIYTSRGLEALTGRLIRNASRLRGQPSAWNRFYRQWKIDRSKSLLPQFKKALRAPRQKQAYPDLIAELNGAYKDLIKEAQDLDSSIRSKRTMASRGSLQVQQRFAAIKQSALNLSNYR